LKIDSAKTTFLPITIVADLVSLRASAVQLLPLPFLAALAFLAVRSAT
jgi:hypothetical protein